MPGVQERGMALRLWLQEQEKVNSLNLLGTLYLPAFQRKVSGASDGA